MTTALIVLIVVGGLVVLMAVASFVRRTGVIRRLNAGSGVIRTPCGLVEHAQYGKGPMILELHGGGSCYDQMIFLVEDLVQNGFSVLLPSRPAYGKAPIASGVTPEEQADLMAALLDALGVDRVAVTVGSASGPAALDFAMRHPERCRGLVMQCAVSLPGKFMPETIRRVLFSAGMSCVMEVFGMRCPILSKIRPPLLAKFGVCRLAIVDRAEATRRFRQVRNHPLWWSAFWRFFARTTYPWRVRSYPAWGNDMKFMSTVPDSPPERIRCPTLVIHDPVDKLVPFSHAEAVADKIPGARLVTLDGWGQLVMFNDESQPARIAFPRDAAARAHPARKP